MSRNEGNETPCEKGLTAFLGKYSRNPAMIRKALVRVGMAERMLCLVDGQPLCQQGDPADCYWVICSGDVRVEGDGVLVVTRRAGEVIGEGAFYRDASDGSSYTPVRGATLRASGDVDVLRIDRALISAMTPDEQAAWHETMACVATTKLDEATKQRVGLHLKQSLYQDLVGRFVCQEGKEAALAALVPGNSARPIAAEACDTVVWFSDIAGFSSFAQSLPPREAGRIVRSIMDVQAEEITAAGGHVDKFMGDGLMAFWRAPDAQRLDAACTSALTAAHRTASRLAALFKEKELPLDIRIGLHAGKVILGDFGGADRIAFTAIGDTVNAAARYEQAAKRSDGGPLGRVRVSPQVFARVKDAAVLENFEENATAFSDKHGRQFEVHVTRY